VNVGFVGNIPPPIGGAEVFLKYFLHRFLRNSRNKVTLVRWRRQVFQYFPERITVRYAPRGTVRRIGRCTLHYLLEAYIPSRKWPRRVFEQRLLQRFARTAQQTTEIFRRARVQLIHSHMLFPNLYFAAHAAKELGVPLVLTIHGMLEFRILDAYIKKSPILVREVAQALAQADTVVAVSDEIARECRKRGAKKVVTIPGGIDSAWFDKSQANGNPRKDIVFLGSVRKDKGAPLLISAFRKNGTSSGGDLIFVGKPLLHGPLWDSARKDPRIHFLGLQDDKKIREVLSRAKMLVLPSASEGLPMAILEGMATGVPVLVSRTGQLPLLIKDGHNGFLIRQRTVTGIAAELDRVSRRDDLGRVSANARRTAERFHIDKVHRRYEDLYRTLVR